MSSNLLREKILPALFTCLICLISAGSLTAQTATWSLRTSNSTEVLSGIAYGVDQFGVGRFVIVGEGGVIVTSPNGTTWTLRSSGTIQDLRGICYANGLFVATGSSGTIVTSPDGITWTTRTSGTNQFLSGVAYGAGKFVAVGAFGLTVSSTNGTDNWVMASSGSFTFLQGVIFANGQFLAYGQKNGLSGTLLASGDGSAWSTVAFPPSGDVNAAAYFKGRYYTGGYSGQIFSSTGFSSTDSGTWRQEALLSQDPNIPIASSAYRGMATDGYTLIAVTDSGSIYTTTDGQNWSSLFSTSIPLFAACFGQELFVSVGGSVSGVIRTSPQNPVPDAFETWRGLEFTEAELTDPAISGPQADPESDGIPNLLEFVHGLSPKSPDANSDKLPGFRNPPTSGGNVEFQWTIDKDSVGKVNLSIYYSETLALDSWEILAVTPTSIESTELFETFTATHTSPPEPNCFYRFHYQLIE